MYFALGNLNNSLEAATTIDDTMVRVDDQEIARNFEEFHTETDGPNGARLESYRLFDNADTPPTEDYIKRLYLHKSTDPSLSGFDTLITYTVGSRVVESSPGVFSPGWAKAHFLYLNGLGQIINYRKISSDQQIGTYTLTSYDSEYDPNHLFTYAYNSERELEEVADKIDQGILSWGMPRAVRRETFDQFIAETINPLIRIMNEMLRQPGSVR